MAAETVDPRPRGPLPLIQRSVAAILIVGVFAVIAYASLTWIAIGGCLAIAENGYDLTAKATQWCSGDGHQSSFAGVTISAAMLAGPFLACFVLAQRALWHRRSVAGVAGWSTASVLPAFLFVIVLRTASLQFLLPAH